MPRAATPDPRELSSLEQSSLCGRSQDEAISFLPRLSCASPRRVREGTDGHSSPLVRGALGPILEAPTLARPRRTSVGPQRPTPAKSHRDQVRFQHVLLLSCSRGCVTECPCSKPNDKGCIRSAVGKASPGVSSPSPGPRGHGIDRWADPTSRTRIATVRPFAMSRVKENGRCNY